ncbi:MAG: hypothetical protein F6K31_07460 [Symploca sp. SIO2G7]|nr:hypothetical protein [Symploca sp. SIO2G7]
MAMKLKLLLGLSTIILSSIATPANALLRTDFENFVRNNNTVLAQVLVVKGYAFANELTNSACNNLYYRETTDVYRDLLNSDVPPNLASEILSFSTAYTCAEKGSQVFINADHVAKRDIPSTIANTPVGYYQAGDTAILQSISADGQWGLLKNGTTRYWVHMDYIGFDI